MARDARPKWANHLGNDDHMVDYSWVAVAFSADQRLGRDLVFPCTNAPEGKNVRTYLIGTYLSGCFQMCSFHVPKLKHWFAFLDCAKSEMGA